MDDQEQFLKENPVSKVLDDLWLGNIYSAEDKNFLDDNNIKTIINLSSFDVKHPKDFDVLDINIKDDPEEDISLYFNLCYDFIENKKTNILVHCYAGVSRSATVVLYYLMRKYDISLHDAMKFLTQKRSFIRPNPGFMVNLIEYDLYRN